MPPDSARGSATAPSSAHPLRAAAPEAADGEVAGFPSAGGAPSAGVWRISGPTPTTYPSAPDPAPAAPAAPAAEPTTAGGTPTVSKASTEAPKKSAPLRPVTSVPGVSARARVTTPTPEEIAAKEAARRAEAERREAERRAEAERREADRREAERRVEAERQAEAQRRADAERLARDEAMREHAARVAAEERAAQAARIEATQVRAAQIEAARAEAARVEAERDRAARARARAEAQRRANIDDVDPAAGRLDDRRAGSAADVTGRLPAVGRAVGKAAGRPDVPADVWTPEHDAAPTPAGTRRIAWLRGRRARRTVLAAAVVAVLGTATGVTIAVATSGSPTRSNIAPAARVAPVGPVLSALGTSAPMPTKAGLSAALAGVVNDKRLGPHVSIAVRDLATGTLLYGQDASSPTVPASSMKLATAAALLSLRGTDYRITTRVVTGAHPGEVVLIGGGDPTLAAGAKATYPGSGRLDVLADQVKRALGGVRPTKVILDTSLFGGPASGPGWQTADDNSTYVHPIYALTTDGGRVNPTKTGNSQRYPNSALAAGQIFARDLGLPTSAVSFGRAPSAPANPPAAGSASAATPGGTLASVQSAPLAEILDTMLQNSDNIVAEFMARQVAIAMGRPASFAGASAAVTAELGKLGMPMAGVHIVDGSGVSHLNRLTPALLTALLSYAAQPSHARLHALYSGLPVAGWSGTLKGRYVSQASTQAAGVLRAKTGTLDGVSALAGTVVDTSGRALSFAVMVDKVPGGLDAPAAEDAIGIVLYRCGCGG